MAETRVSIPWLKVNKVVTRTYRPRNSGRSNNLAVVESRGFGIYSHDRSTWRIIDLGESGPVFGIRERYNQLYVDREHSAQHRVSVEEKREDCQN